MANRKPRYLCRYGWNSLTSFRGTRREIINRLKRIAYPTWADSLHIEDEQGKLLLGCEDVQDEQGRWTTREADNFFTPAEYAELCG